MRIGKEGPDAAPQFGDPNENPGPLPAAMRHKKGEPVRPIETVFSMKPPAQWLE
jgi:hypothetical protein